MGMAPPPAVMVRKGTGGDILACLSIAVALPAYFTRTGLAEMKCQLPLQDVYVADEGTTVVGFAAIERKNAAVAELAWIAVAADRHGRGTGRALLAQVDADLLRAGLRLLEVKTLADTAGYEPYIRTRRFYALAGFVHLDTVDPFPGWDPGNPCAILVKVLGDGA